MNIISLDSTIYAQTEKELDSLLISEISALVYLDSITITPSQDSLDLESFIKLVLEDKSFYKAFQNLRITEHQINDEIQYFNKRGKQIASFYGTHLQIVENLCRTMKTISSKVDGKYFNRKKHYKFYTSSFIDRVFYTRGKECFDTMRVKLHSDNTSTFEYQINQLKTIIFEPGQEVDIPIVGKKMAIFSHRMRKFYDYSISFRPDLGDNGAYVFAVDIKPEYQKKDGKTIIRQLSTYFDASNFQILARDYAMDMKSPIYDLDINVHVELTQFDAKYIPSIIRYQGKWKVPAKKPEICNFTIQFSEYK